MTETKAPPKRVYLSDNAQVAALIDVPSPNPKSNLVVWVMHDELAIGDFYNGLAAAAALNPKEIKIVSNHSYFDGGYEFHKNYYALKEVYPCSFIDPKTLNTYIEESDPDSYPHVIIQSCRQPIFERLNYKFSQNQLPELQNTLKVAMAMPDVIGESTIHVGADISIRFTPQIDENETLTDNTIVVPLVPTRITPKSIAGAAKSAPESYDCFKTSGAHPVYAVAVGERLDNDLEASIKDAKNLAARLVETISKTGGSLMVTTSSRTKPETAAALRQALDTQLPSGTTFSFYNYRESGKNYNPHKAAMGMADVIIVTDDSMSMASDAIASAKPFFMAERLPLKEPEEKGYHKNRVRINDKHINLLKDNAYARSIDHLPNHQQLSPTVQYNSAHEIAQAIKTKLKLRDIQTEQPKTFIEDLMDKTKIGMHAIGLRQRPGSYLSER